MSTIKINRASKLSSTGAFPATFEAIVSKIPPSAIAALTSAQLAEVVDAMRGQYEVGYSVGYKDAV
jgi:hypothetical protein